MPIPVISVAKMREWESVSWASCIAESDVIQEVGRQIGARVSRLAKPGERILVLAGKGHNGDDARASVPHLAKLQIDLLNIDSPLQKLSALRECLEQRPAWIVDGLFGIGLNRPLGQDWIEFIESINKSGRPVLAIDVPSGLNSDTGAVQPIAIEATITLTLGAPKAGLLLPEALGYVGRLEVAGDIGLAPFSCDSDQFWSQPEDFRDYPPRRPIDSNKGNFGHLVAVAGTGGFHGAAVLCARAAARANPGLVTVYTDEKSYQPVAGQLQSAMVHPWRPGMPWPPRTTALCIGPGLANPTHPEIKNQVGTWWRTFPGPMVADASALDWLPAGVVETEAPRVITPHPGEAARMLQRETSAILMNRKGALDELSRKYGRCWVILKGHQTLVGRGGFPSYINPTGNPGLAQGGTGDVLAGYLGGLLAQPSLQADTCRTLRYGVWRHGLAADALSERRRHWVTEELIDALGD